MDNCDEAEKIVIGKCALKAYSTTNNVCAVLACILTICAFIFDIGILPSFVVCLIWVINQSVYCRETIKYSKGSKISWSLKGHCAICKINISCNRKGNRND